MSTTDSATPSSRCADEAASPSTLEKEALHALLEVPLTTAARRQVIAGEFDKSALRDELRAVCASAKLRGVRAEHVLIAVKEIWSALPDAHALPHDSIERPVLNQIVSMTLDEYYPRNEAES